MTKLIVAIIFALTIAPSTSLASVGSEIIKGISKYIAKETGQEATEQGVKQMIKQVGEELIERTAQKITRQGGEESLATVAEMVAKHGPEVIRALDNVPDALPVIKLLDELPASEVRIAASRLAAGRTGSELATISTRLGTTALRAETMHPGIGMRFAQALGKDGAELSMKLTSDQAVQIGRHIDDIALLPKNEQSQILALIDSNAERFTSFVGRFVEKHPGKVLFTTAAAPIILLNSDAVFGEGDPVFDPDNNLIRDKDGNPMLLHKGIVPETVKTSLRIFEMPVQLTLYAIGAAICVAVSFFLTSKVYLSFKKDQIQLDMANTVAKQTKNEMARSEMNDGVSRS